MTTGYWRDDALCDPDTAALFDPPRAGEGLRFIDRLQAALALCADCPVKRPCLAEAKTAGLDGIFAGTLLADGKPAVWNPPGRPGTGAA